jgi:hypothetical protein
MLMAGIHPGAVSERLADPNVGITTLGVLHGDVLPGFQEAGAEKFDRIFEVGEEDKLERNVSKLRGLS